MILLTVQRRERAILEQGSDHWRANRCLAVAFPQREGDDSGHRFSAVFALGVADQRLLGNQKRLLRVKKILLQPLLPEEGIVIGILMAISPQKIKRWVVGQSRKADGRNARQVAKLGLPYFEGR